MAPSQPSSLISKINSYYESRTSAVLFIKQPPNVTTLEQRVEALHITNSPNHINMPVHPAEETAGGNITDKVAKESSDSNASTHPLHDEENNATSGGSVSANAHKANPGPVHADNLPTPASKEELKKRAEELNK
jgi:hypothetical protein